MWKDHFNSLYNPVPDNGVKENVVGMIERHEDPMCWQVGLTIADVYDILSRQKRNRSAGPNGLCMEIILHGSIRILLHLSLFFTCCISHSHSYLPSASMDTEFVPLLKNKTGDITDVSNYRAIAISNAESKLLENVILQCIQSSRNDVSCYQLGFKKGHSTGLCTYMLKQTVEYYTLGGVHVFVFCRF